MISHVSSNVSRVQEILEALDTVACQRIRFRYPKTRFVREDDEHHQLNLHKERSACGSAPKGHIVVRDVLQG